jgi:DNA-binding response OmpR family regulator
MQDRPQVMVVEDDAEMNQLERELLALCGLDAVAAYSGAEAVRRFDQCPTDAVLLDLMLPEMDGFEACDHLRRNAGRHVPIVVVTALDDDASRRRATQAGADAYFVKPIDVGSVVATLRSLIGAGEPSL